MRKIERQMNFALSNKGNWSKDNTRVEFNESTNCSTVFLHGHSIATYDHALKAVKISSCGWETNTTKSRLNAILQEVKPGCGVFQKNFDWFVSYCDDVKDFWDGMILIDADHLETACPAITQTVTPNPHGGFFIGIIKEWETNPQSVFFTFVFP